MIRLNARFSTRFVCGYNSRTLCQRYSTLFADFHQNRPASSGPKICKIELQLALAPELSIVLFAPDFKLF